MEGLAEKVNANAALVRRGQYLDTTVLIEIGTTGWLVHIEKGRIAAVRPSSLVIANWAFALRASESVWQAFWQPLPKPGFHDLMALIKGRHLKAEGDIKVFMTNLRYFKEVLGSLRTTRAAA